MENTVPARKRKKKSSRRFAIVVCGLIALVMVIAGIKKQPSINKNKEIINELNGQIAEQTKKQEEVDRMRENVNSDEYIEKIARDELGMVKNDEIVFVDISEEE